MNLRTRVKLPCGRDPESCQHHLDVTLHDLLARLNSYLSSQGLNISTSREKVLATLSKQKGHFSASDLIQEIARKNPGIGAATVYRSLPIFVNAGILRETLTTQSGETIYELENEHHHDHIVCLDCQAIFEFHEPKIERAQEEMASSLDFSPKTHRHVIYARCDLLASKK